jgi:hypothetical protein
MKGASQHNSYVHAVNSTYLLATGAQRQIFSVLGSMGITMGYSSVIFQPPERGKEIETEVSMAFGLIPIRPTNALLAR